MDNQNPYGAGGGGGFGAGGYQPPGGGGFQPPAGGYPGGGAGGGGPSGVGGTLDVGDVLSTTFRTMGAALVPILGCALSVVIPTSIVTFVLRVAIYLVMQNMDHATPDQAMMGAVIALPVYLVFILVLLATQAVGQGGIVYSVAEQLSGRSPTLGQAFRVGLSRAFWVFLTTFIATIGIFIGMMFCVAPGVVVAIFLCVAAPVCIVEKLGPIDSLQRSIALTEGNRLTIFLVFLAVMVGWFVIAMCIIAPVQLLVVGGAAAVGGAGGVQAMQNPLSLGSIIGELINIPVTLFATMAGSTLVAVIYARLRGLRDGVDAQAIASVFT
jgi:hypothetical protein